MIYLGADHKGFELKNKIKEWLDQWGYEYEDMGAFEFNKDDDYPDFISEAAKRVSQDPENGKAIILGGSGQGEAMVANRYRGIRAAVYYGGDPGGIINLQKTREHNNSNILSLGASYLTENDAKNAVDCWLKTEFSGEERHIRRIKKIDK